MRILFLNHASSIEQLRDWEGLFQMHFIGPLSETNQAEYSVFWFANGEARREPPIDWELFQWVVKYQPDALMVSGWSHYGADPDRQAVTLFTLYLIRKLLGIKIAACLFDQAYEQFRVSDILVRFCDVAFTNEHRKYYQNYTLWADKLRQTSAAISSHLFVADPFAPRSFDVTFVGGVGGYANDDRLNGINYLRRYGINVFDPGGRGLNQARLTNAQYASCLRDSAISLNWSRHQSGCWFQAKKRIFESTLAGALLICEACEEVDQYLNPYVDYVPFSSLDQLLARCRYYLAHPEERLRIAEHGHKTALAQYRADLIWAKDLQVLSDTDRYREPEALEGLAQHCTGHELNVARFFKEAINREFPGLDQAKVAAAVALVEGAASANTAAIAILANPKPTKAQSAEVDRIAEVAGAGKASDQAMLLSPNADLVVRSADQTACPMDLSTVYDPETQRIQVPKRPCCLLLHQKLDARDALGHEFPVRDFLTSSFKQAQLGTLVEYYLGAEFWNASPFPEKPLVDLVRELKPNLILLSGYDPNCLQHPSFPVLQALRLLQDVPIAAFWHDTAGESARNCYGPLITNDIDLHILTDSHAWIGHFSGVKFLRAVPSPDPQLFYAGPEAPDLDVSFLGSDDSSGIESRAALEYLTERGLSVYVPDDQTGTPAALSERAASMRRSKICLNFSESLESQNRLSPHVLEVLFSGSLLLENPNNETLRYFVAGRDFVRFESKEVLFDKVQYYLTHEDERKQIAASGLYQATTRLNGTAFWKSIFSELVALKLWPAHWD